MQVNSALIIQTAFIEDVILATPLIENVRDRYPKAPIDVLVNRNTASLLQSAQLMRGAVINYVNDSAPLHLASSVNAPVCVVYCSTVPQFGFYPLSEASWVVEVAEPLACRPCGLHGHRACPEGHFRCARDIIVQQLLYPYQQAAARV